MVDLNKADEFIERARIDCTAIQCLLPHINAVPETICDMCQQCAEKLIKQVYLDHGRIPARSHDLYDLAGEAIDRGWIDATADEVKSLLFLKNYGAKARYLTLSESEKAEGATAVASLVAICDMLDRNGCQSVELEIDIKFLHSWEFVPESETSLDGIVSIMEKTSSCFHEDNDPCL